MPVPEPHLKSMPSVLARSMIDSMSSCTELMKQAEHCGLGCTPTLNHTGELKAIFCSTSRCVSSSRKASREAGDWRSSRPSRPSRRSCSPRGRSVGAPNFRARGVLSLP